MIPLYPTHTKAHHPPPPSETCWTHRHYLAPHAISSKLLAKKWQDRARQMHLRKLKDAKSTIDNRPPKVYPHLEMRLKKLQVEQERLYEIERTNHILLDRIAFQLVESPAQVSDLENARKDPVPPPSLHGPKRKRDLKRIAVQNETILQRIEDRPPTYPRQQFFSSRCQNLVYLRNIAQYPESYARLLDNHLALDHPSGCGCMAGAFMLEYGGENGLFDEEGGGGQERATSARSRSNGVGGGATRETRSADVNMYGRPATRPNTMVGPLSPAGSSSPSPSQQPDDELDQEFGPDVAASDEYDDDYDEEFVEGEEGGSVVYYSSEEDATNGVNDQESSGKYSPQPPSVENDSARAPVKSSRPPAKASNARTPNSTSRPTKSTPSPPRRTSSESFPPLQSQATTPPRKDSLTQKTDRKPASLTGSTSSVKSSSSKKTGGKGFPKI
ncbi:KIAA1430-like protein-domain-containing protein [Phlyctochytrium arcticum]|nr:KIAA1430-like protein-domain-containing protein [Phlyctochytrium arcticum]